MLSCAPPSSSAARGGRVRGRLLPAPATVLRSPSPAAWCIKGAQRPRRANGRPVQGLRRRTGPRPTNKPAPASGHPGQHLTATRQPRLWLTRPADVCLLSHMQDAKIAQLVEQLIRNQQVVGSIPILGSITLHRLHHRRSDPKDWQRPKIYRNDNADLNVNCLDLRDRVVSLMCECLKCSVWTCEGYIAA